MKPSNFPQSNVILAKNQKEYLPLPVFYNAQSVAGELISCWKLTLWERIKVLLGGKVWVTVLSFHNQAQPIRPSIESPFVKE